jgi:hypothetical protein
MFKTCEIYLKLFRKIFKFFFKFYQQNRRMSSIKELINENFLKNQTLGSIFCELQSFSVTGNFVYQTVKRYKKTGCVVKRKYLTQKQPASNLPVIKTIRESIITVENISIDSIF